MKEKARATAGERRGRHRPAAAVVAGHDVELAGAIRKELLEQIERLVHGLGVRERPEVASAAIAEGAGAQDPRKVLTECDLDVRIRLVVLEANVVARVVLLDEV